MIVNINANKSFSEQLEEHIATDPKCLHNKALEESPEYKREIWYYMVYSTGVFPFFYL